MQDRFTMARIGVGAVVATLAAGADRPLAQSPATEPVANTAAWVVEGAGRSADVRIAPFLGRDDAMWLRNNTQAIHTGAGFTDGTIEFEVAPMDRADFVGVVFHRQSFTHHENIYLRPRQSGQYMALQYAPRTNGSSTWQLYREFTHTVAWPRNVWTPVRIEVKGSALSVSGGGTTAPLEVPRLRLGLNGGPIAFWARVNDAPAEWAAAISKLRITPAPPQTKTAQGPPPRGYIPAWRVSAPIDAADGSRPVDLAAFDQSAWRDLTAEESGLVNLNRAFPAKRGRFAVAATVTLPSTGERLVRAGMGYSDDVTVFLNGRPLYRGTNGWDSRTPQLVSFVDARFEQVFLPLRAGDNELVLVVTDDQRFGWGFAVTIDDAELASRARTQLTRQLPGPRGSPQLPQAPTGRD